MKRILTEDNYVVLQEIASDNSITLQLGYALGGITYKIENGNVKFYLKDDYFYKNCIFSADLPLNIDGTSYDEEDIAEALSRLFGIANISVTSVNGMQGDVVLTAEDVDAYSKDEVDDLIDSLETDIEGIEEEIDDLDEQVSANTTAIEGIQQDIANKEHFRGYYATNAEIQALTASNGDFAYSAQSGTKWVYNNSTWTDSQEAVPDQTVEKSTTTPLMDGTAAIGDSNRYAAADHVHPTDTSRASQSDFAALSQQVGTNTAAIANKADQSDLNDLTSNLTNNYYTKSETDTALGGKQDTLTAGANISIQNNVISASGSAAQVQSDWNQNDSNSVDYIKNKPDLSIYAQSGNLSTVATSGDYNDLSNKPTIPTVPTNVSAFTNDAGYLTQHQSLSNYYTKTESDNKFALKFTDVDDIQKVNALPANPDSRTLYLIPVQ